MIAEYELPVPETSDRVILLGNSGEGKSVLSIALLLAKPHVVFVDTKQSPRERAEIDTIGPEIRGEEYRRIGGGRYVYRPPLEWTDDMEMRNHFFKWALTEGGGNRVIYLDEIIDSAESASKYPRWMRLCAQRGRSANLGLWGTTQQPRGVPLWSVGQANFTYVFHTGLPEYQDRIDEIMEQPVPWNLLPQESHRFVWKDRRGLHGPFSLDLDELHAEQGIIARPA